MARRMQLTALNTLHCNLLKITVCHGCFLGSHKVKWNVLVPIYDVQSSKSFDFTKDGLSRICDLPLFKASLEDLTLEKYIATVGFVIRVYPYKGREKVYKDLAQAQFYVLFVIVIGMLQFEKMAEAVMEGNK